MRGRKRVHNIVDIKITNKNIQRLRRGLRVHKMVKGTKYCIFKKDKTDIKVIRLVKRISVLRAYLKAYKEALKKEVSAPKDEVFCAVSKQ